MVYVYLSDGNGRGKIIAELDESFETFEGAIVMLVDTNTENWQMLKAAQWGEGLWAKAKLTAKGKKR